MIVVIGAGVAGLTAVRKLVSRRVPVTLVTAGGFGQDAVAAGNTALAQGGIAAALGPDDDPSLHAADTVRAGAGLVDHSAAHLLAHEGAVRVEQLLAAGFTADRDSHGKLTFGLEAAHSRARIVHAGEDRSGAALSMFLTSDVQHHIAAGRVQLIEHAHLTALTVRKQRITGITYDDATGTHHDLAADAVLLATGGYAGLFATTSSSDAVTGHGVLAAARAGAVLADLEFIQFHPTALATTGELLSEAVRGAGAVLRAPDGQRFMLDVHPDAELAARDIVSRASVAVMQHTGRSSVWLDATVLEHRHGAGTLARRFPVLTQRLTDRGIDWTTQWVPVAPAAHYCMGGVATDLSARTNVVGLFAAGEVASTGVHGANRLASNSLLEGLVFGHRAAEAAVQYLHDASWNLDTNFSTFTANAQIITGATAHRGTAHEESEQLCTLRGLTEQYVGMLRTTEGFARLHAQLDRVSHPLTDMVRLIATAAAARTESRGGHWHADYPVADPEQAFRTAWRLAAASHPPIVETQEHLAHVDA